MLQRLLNSVITVGMFAVAVAVVYLAAQPRSFARTSWSNFRRDQATKRTLSQDWLQIASSSARLDFANADSSAEVVEFSDYECPFCRKADGVIDSVLLDTPMRIAYRHVPLRIHPAAAGAARASICAEGQGRFREMHHELMTTTKWQTDSNWTREAKAAGVPNIAAFETCLSSASTSRRLTQDSTFAASLRVDGTPSFFSARRAHRGAINSVLLRSLAGR